ncbi:hypothetical protein [Nocardia farcinica]|uniref:hypothetical protein n=1 Tax=Nocardia farcinica TaxID=37329 RepID=UPI001E3D63D0|nr:hypothetical protein [Nocardia farcinica]
MAELDAAAADLDPPFAVVDLGARRQCGRTGPAHRREATILLASKSVRSRDLIGRATKLPG